MHSLPSLPLPNSAGSSSVLDGDGGDEDDEEKKKEGEDKKEEKEEGEEVVEFLDFLRSDNLGSCELLEPVSHLRRWPGCRYCEGGLLSD